MTGITIEQTRNHEVTLFVLEGEVLCRLADGTVSLHAGDTLHLRAGVPRAWRPAGPGGARVLQAFGAPSWAG
jgi:quercetin dioxygenase-like cupin family protein